MKPREPKISFGLKDAIAIYRFFYITSSNLPVHRDYQKIENRLKRWIDRHNKT